MFENNKNEVRRGRQDKGVSDFAESLLSQANESWILLLNPWTPLKKNFNSKETNTQILPMLAACSEMRRALSLGLCLLYPEMNGEGQHHRHLTVPGVWSPPGPL